MDDRRPTGQAGFTLVEALVSLVVAGLVLAVLGRAMAGAWGAAKAPLDVLSGMALARSAVLGAPADAFEAARARGFGLDRSSAALSVDHLASRLAPAFTEATKRGLAEAKATPPGMQLAEPAGLVETGAGDARPELRVVSVVVRTPMGRRLRLDTIRLDHVTP